MTLKPWFVAALCLLLSTVTRADTIVTSDGPRSGEIVRVDAQNIVFRMDVGEVTIPRTAITEVRVDQPPAYEAAVNALGAGKYAEAVQTLKPITDRLAGLDVDWVEDALWRLGDALVGEKKLTEAKAVFDRFKTFYPDSPRTAGLDTKYARILVAQNNCSEATPLLTKLVEPLLAKKAITEDEEPAVAEGLILLGDCQRAAGKLDDALDSYLNVVALFDLEPNFAAEAKYKAARIFEEKKNWRRARGFYRELGESAPQADIVADAKKRFAALTEAHPE